ncbi:MAG: pyrroline-5-carboxylate reductase, partial [Bacteroidetes bacterium]
MLNDQTVAIIGAGNIGRALLGGLLHGHGLEPGQIRATRRNPAMLSDLQSEFPGIQIGTDNAAAVRGASVVVLAIKPQNARDVIAQIRNHVEADAMIVSVLAGLTTDYLQAAFGRPMAVIR